MPDGGRGGRAPESAGGQGLHGGDGPETILNDPFRRTVRKANKPKKVEVDGVSILLVKREDEIYALTETCPHLGGPLSEGKLVGDAIECPWHGSQLALEDGHVVNGPTAYPARCYDVRVRGGYVEVRAVKRA